MVMNKPGANTCMPKQNELPCSTQGVQVHSSLWLQGGLSHSLQEEAEEAKQL